MTAPGLSSATDSGDQCPAMATGACARFYRGGGAAIRGLASAGVVALALVSGCGTITPPSTSGVPFDRSYFSLDDEAQTQEMVLYALGLLDTGYRFGGRNPEAGLDCSGMVAYIVERISGRQLPHNAAQIADRTRPIEIDALQPGDLVFFNTMRRRYSHMGIYIGDGRFIHAPSSRGAVRVERMDSTYFKPRFDGARTLLATTRSVGASASANSGHTDL